MRAFVKSWSAQALSAAAVMLLVASSPPSPKILAAAAPVGQLAEQQIHIPPVDAPVTDPFRLPEHEFGPGNRGIEYRTTVGAEVVASAPGTVSFAGSVAGSSFVTVDHGGGLVTTVGFLDEVAVGRGEVVGQGDVLGLAGDRTHFSARQDGVYFDPVLLFGAVHISVRLVDGPN